MTGNDVTYTYGTTCTETCIFNDVTLYTNPYLVATDKGYTKHYYAGTERVAAHIGDGGLAALTHHVIDYDDRLQEKVDLLFEQSFEQINTRELHGNDLFCIESISNTSNELVCELKEIPEQLHGYAEIDVSNFGDGIYSRLEDRSNGQEPDCYFYHSDHLGSASWITDQHGDAVQHIQYLPYGEPYINQRLSGYNERFTFTGKETDCETGFSYFGARYYDPTLLTSFISIDRYADKYPNLSPYHYCARSPIRSTDPNGDSVVFMDENTKSLWSKTYNNITCRLAQLNQKSNLKGLGKSNQAEFDQLTEIKTAMDVVQKSKTLFLYSSLENDGTKISGGSTYKLLGENQIRVEVMDGCDGSLIHETRHASGFLHNEWGFSDQIGSDNHLIPINYDWQDEFEAYRIENDYNYYLNNQEWYDDNRIRNNIRSWYDNNDYIIKEFHQYTQSNHYITK